MFMPNTVQAECLEWDLSQVPVWNIKQSNDAILALTFKQNDTQLKGSGSFYFLPN
jgi:hypothetical protein